MNMLGVPKYTVNREPPFPIRLVFWGDWAFPWGCTGVVWAKIAEDYGAKIAEAQQ
jgi:hypothetical protein